MFLVGPRKSRSIKKYSGSIADVFDYLAALHTGKRSDNRERVLMHCTPAAFFLVEPKMANSIGKANTWQVQCIPLLKSMDQSMYSMLSQRQVSLLLKDSNGRVKALSREHLPYSSIELG